MSLIKLTHTATFFKSIVNVRKWKTTTQNVKLKHTKCTAKSMFTTHNQADALVAFWSVLSRHENRGQSTRCARGQKGLRNKDHRARSLLVVPRSSSLAVSILS